MTAPLSPDELESRRRARAATQARDDQGVCRCDTPMSNPRVVIGIALDGIECGRCHRLIEPTT